MDRGKLNSNKSTVEEEELEDGEIATIRRQTGFKNENISQIRALFDFYDIDRDGLLSTEQALLLLRTLGFHPCEPAQLRGADGQGRVNFHATMRSAAYVRDYVFTRDRRGSSRHVYRMIHQRGKEYTLGAVFLHRFFLSISLDLPLPAVERIAEAIGKDGEPSFSEEEFVNYIDASWRNLGRAPGSPHGQSVSPSPGIVTSRSGMRVGHNAMKVTEKPQTAPLNATVMMPS